MPPAGRTYTAQFLFSAEDGVVIRTTAVDGETGLTVPEAEEAADMPCLLSVHFMREADSDGDLKYAIELNSGKPVK